MLQAEYEYIKEDLEELRLNLWDGRLVMEGKDRNTGEWVVLYY
jgi:hypothetical protein